MNDEYFYTLSHLPKLPNHLIEEANNCAYEDANEKHLRIIGRKCSFATSKFCIDLTKQFGYVYPVYLKLNPMTCYNWHEDGHKNVGINFSLSNTTEYLTLFREKIDNLTYKIHNCVYEYAVPTVFNTAISHCVINYSNQPRYVLTLEFSKNVYFNEVKDYLINYNTADYFNNYFSE